MSDFLSLSLVEQFRIIQNLIKDIRFILRSLESSSTRAGKTDGARQDLAQIKSSFEAIRRSLGEKDRRFLEEEIEALEEELKELEEGCFA